VEPCQRRLQEREEITAAVRAMGRKSGKTRLENGFLRGKNEPAAFPVTGYGFIYLKSRKMAGCSGLP